jgi:ABC-2 type transport system ATP-binding protein
VDEVSRLRERKFKEVTVVYDGPPPALERLEGAEVTWQQEGRMTFRVRSEIEPLLAALQECNLRDLSITEPSLEEVFLDYFTGASAGDSA